MALQELCPPAQLSELGLMLVQEELSGRCGQRRCPLIDVALNIWFI